MHTRTIAYHFDGDQFRDVPGDQFLQAIGYLSWWGGSAYDLVDIHKDSLSTKNMDLIAYYSNSKDDSKFVLGAVWRKDMKEYTFHS